MKDSEKADGPWTTKDVVIGVVVPLAKTAIGAVAALVAAGVL